MQRRMWNSTKKSRCFRFAVIHIVHFQNDKMTRFSLLGGTLFLRFDETIDRVEVQSQHPHGMRCAMLRPLYEFKKVDMMLNITWSGSGSGSVSCVSGIRYIATPAPFCGLQSNGSPGTRVIHAISRPQVTREQANNQQVQVVRQ
jgi:hypothetical protein